MVLLNYRDAPSAAGDDYLPGIGKRPDSFDFYDINGLGSRNYPAEAFARLLYYIIPFFISISASSFDI